MLIVHADRHREHPTDRAMPGYGRDYPEVPDRVDRILAAVTEADLGPVATPTDFGLAPIEAVHDAGLLAHLRDAAHLDVLDRLRIEVEPLDQPVEDLSCELVRPHRRERAVPLPDRAADGVDDQRITHRAQRTTATRLERP